MDQRSGDEREDARLFRALPLLASTLHGRPGARAGLMAAGRPACMLVAAGADVFGTVRLLAAYDSSAL
jgi:hypothetical protein